MLFFGVQCRCSECQVKGYIILSKETRIEKKKKAFGKSFVQVKWFLLISGLGLILACRSWSQIRVPGLGRDISHVSIDA